MRHLTRQVMVGDVPIGAGAPITVQSMTNTDTRNALATLTQIEALASAGCDIVRVAVPDEEALKLYFRSYHRALCLWSRIFILITAWPYDL